MEVICLSYSTQILKEGRYWLASGSRDKLITIFDSSEDYEAVAVLEHHSSTITSLQFYQDNEELSLMSCGADKTIVKKEINLKAVAAFSDFESLQLAESTDIFTMTRNLQCKNKVFSMDIAERAQFMATGHDRQLSMWQLPNLENMWNYVSADPQEV